MIPATANGGFPLPAPGGAQRVVEATHSGCAARTRVSLPAGLPVRSVRRIFCAHCERLCEATAISEVRPGLGERFRAMLPSTPAFSPPTVSLPAPLAGYDLRWLTLPIAALAVFAVLSLLNGDESPAPQLASTAPAADASQGRRRQDRRKGQQGQRPEKAGRPGRCATRRRVDLLTGAARRLGSCEPRRRRDLRCGLG